MTGPVLNEHFRTFLGPPFVALGHLSSPRGVRAFHELRRYHTRPLQLNWGPQNVHFGKTHFWDPNINDRIFKNSFGVVFDQN